MWNSNGKKSVAIEGVGVWVVTGVVMWSRGVVVWSLRCLGDGGGGQLCSVKVGGGGWMTWGVMMQVIIDIIFTNQPPNKHENT